MTVVRGEAIGVIVYDHFPRLKTIANGVLQIVFGVILIALSFPNQIRLMTCQRHNELETDKSVPGVDASLLVWIIT